MTTPGAVTVIAPIEPRNDAAFHVVEDVDIKGGAHAVADVTARDAIPSHLLTPGTLAVLPDGTQYVWSGSAWVAAGGGGAVDSVNGQTGVVVLDAGDVGADPTGTAAAAIVSHVAASDPHGDRAFATSAAASAVAGHVAASDPHGDRAYAAGLVGALPAQTGQAPRTRAGSTDNFGLPTVGLTYFGSVGPSTVAIALAGRMHLLPFVCHRNVTVTEACINVAAAGTAGSVGNLLIYEATQDPTTGAWSFGALVANLGSVAIDSLGNKTITGLSVALTRGASYAVAFTPSAACSITCLNLQEIAWRGWRGTTAVATIDIYRADSAYPVVSPCPAVTEVSSGLGYVRCPVGLRWTG